MNRPQAILTTAALGLFAPPVLAGELPPAARPNIIFILADDLGYGDVHRLNPDHGKIATPRLDKLAAQGMTFTDAHSSSAVCTPSRYSVLTGRYNWRSHLQSGVIGGFSPPLIQPGRLTVAELLKQQGYQTAVIGKWHLGMNFAETGGKRDLAGKISNGPTAHGFDYFFGISASLDMAPFAYIENDRFTQAPTVIKEWVRPGPAAPDFEAVDVLPELTRKAKEFITKSVTAKQPFFLYMPLTSPHTPLVPTKEWQGKSGLGDYGDFVMETDWAVGEVLAELDRSGAAGNTLVLLSSDNGCAPYVGDSRQAPPPGSSEPNTQKDALGNYRKYQQLEALGHFSSFPFRGHKADIWDGGHRVPLFARWPGKVKAGSVSDQLVCLVDFMATCAEIAGAKLPENAGEDSVSILPALLGKTETPLRETLISHSINGSFAIRKGRWKLELCPDSGGWGDPKPGSKEASDLPPVQLYDMVNDPGETMNEAATHPGILAQLNAQLQKQVTDGRSTPGPPLKNDVPVLIRKSPAAHKADN